jgi:hypothetical protein
MKKAQACFWLPPEKQVGVARPDCTVVGDRVRKMAIFGHWAKSKRAVDRWQDRYTVRGPAGVRRDATTCPGRKSPWRRLSLSKWWRPPAGTH